MFTLCATICNTTTTATTTTTTLLNNNIKQRYAARNNNNNIRRGNLLIVSVGVSEKDDVPVGAKVKVNQSVVVYHVPKSKGAATDINGMLGEVAQRADDYEGTYISANLPIKVAFANPNGGDKTFLVHLKADELEIL